MPARSAPRQASYIVGLVAVAVAGVDLAGGFLRMLAGRPTGFLRMSDISPLDGEAGAVWLWTVLLALGLVLLIIAGRRRRRIFHKRR